jgi:ribose 5-phosphate isomerase A
MESKKLAGEKAVEYVEDGMILGLGTGSTVYWTIKKLGDLVKNGLNISCVPTSKHTEQLATELGIPLVNIAEINELDLTIDGADEVNPRLDLIKGGGGALLREKMIASISRRLVIVVDDTKYVSTLGKFPLPIEVVPFGWELTSKQRNKLGPCNPILRKENNAPFVTDNGNYILDCQFEAIHDPDLLNGKLNIIPGVVDNGLFVNMTDIVIIGGRNGDVETKVRTD